MSYSQCLTSADQREGANGPQGSSERDTLPHGPGAVGAGHLPEPPQHGPDAAQHSQADPGEHHWHAAGAPHRRQRPAGQNTPVGKGGQKGKKHRGKKKSGHLLSN